MSDLSPAVIFHPFTATGYDVIHFIGSSILMGYANLKACSFTLLGCYLNGAVKPINNYLANR